MRSESRSLCGVRTQVVLGDQLEDRFADLFPVLAGSEPAEGADLEISCTLRFVPFVRALQPLFHHGRTTAFADGDDVVLYEGASTVRVEAGGARIIAHVDPDSLE